MSNAFQTEFALRNSINIRSYIKTMITESKKIRIIEHDDLVEELLKSDFFTSAFVHEVDL